MNEVNLTDIFKDLREQDRAILLKHYFSKAISYEVDPDIMITYSHAYNKIFINKKV